MGGVKSSVVVTLAVAPVLAVAPELAVAPALIVAPALAVTPALAGVSSSSTLLDTGPFIKSLRVILVPILSSQYFLSFLLKSLSFIHPFVISNSTPGMVENTYCFNCHTSLSSL